MTSLYVPSVRLVTLIPVRFATMDAAPSEQKYRFIAAILAGLLLLDTTGGMAFVGA